MAKSTAEIVVAGFVGGLPKSERRNIKCRRIVVNGRPMIDLREYVIDAKGRHVPTRKGVCFPQENLGQLRALIDRLAGMPARAAAGDSEDQELLPEGVAVG